MSQTVIQINLQRHFGGGEVYTRFLTSALAHHGCRTLLVVADDAPFWRQLDLPNTTLLPVASLREVAAQLPGVATPIITHGPVDGESLAAWRRVHPVFGIAHMPLFGRNPRVFDGYSGVFAVSAYVLASLRDAGVPNPCPEPLYGVADLARFASADIGRIVQTSEYEWDMRKGRDRLLSWLEPLVEPLRRRPVFERRPGLALGIVSRITPIKQFPLLFKHIAPLLAEFPAITLDIFGAGGYASVRDLRAALAPIKSQTRFWGHQHDVGSIYRQLDFVLSGLPEKEALGLNIIEAQACNTPVLAVNAPPFTETVAHGQTGLLYRDPREDQGQELRQLLAALTAGDARPKPLDHPEHLARFSFEAFVQRTGHVLDFIRQSAA